MLTTQHGPGDAITHGVCMGHPHDPRTAELSEEIESFLDLADELRPQLSAMEDAARANNLRGATAALNAMLKALQP